LGDIVAGGVLSVLDVGCGVVVRAAGCLGSGQGQNRGGEREEGDD